MTRVAITSKSILTPTAELLEWDTEFFKQRIGRAYSPDVDRWAAENTIGTVCLLVGSDEPDRWQDAEARGFRLMDTRVLMERSTAPTMALARAYRPSDLDDLVRIARESHRITRFYADPAFADERCDDLYEAWIRNSVDGWAQKVLVIDGDGGGGVAGYVTVHVDGESGSIGLIAVAEFERGRGLGAALVRAAIDWCHTKAVLYITVVTQGRNVAAQRVFQACGFRTSRVDYWFHRHFPENADVH